MNKTLLSVSVGALAFANSAFATLIVDNSTAGMYVNLGQVLDGTSFMFPIANSAGGDPTLDIPAGTPPDLSAASAQLGNWLTSPATPGGAWVGPQGIPGGWAVNSETAIIYTVNTAGLDNVVASFGVDNGIFLWVDGQFKGGYLRPGGAALGEHVFNLGSLSAGTHYIQVLREDHGGGTGYAVSINGTDAPAVPEPSTLALLGLGVVGAAFAARKKRNSDRAGL